MAIPLVAGAFYLTVAACGTGTNGPMGPGPVASCLAMHDPNKDCDVDGWTPTNGDCNDGDASIYPKAKELCDHKDHDCNQIIDDICDDDKDGYAIIANGSLPGGDCNDADPLVNPGAFEFNGNKIDDDCDGCDPTGQNCMPSGIDNPYPDCVVTPMDPNTKMPTEAIQYTQSIGLCGKWVMDAMINGDSDPASRKIKLSFGKYMPRQGKDFAVFSTGIAGDESDKDFVQPQPGTRFHNSDPNPFPQDSKNACYSGPDELNVHDYVEMRMSLKVPTNAKSFSFDFKFLSAEYPEYVGTQYNDKFLALLDSKAYRGNVSFDKGQHPINVNAAFFDVCDTADICNGMAQNLCSKSAGELDGTGYELSDGNGNRIGGATEWLVTTAPIVPGEMISLRFILFDEGDPLLDSSVIIDNFKWQITPSEVTTNPG